MNSPSLEFIFKHSVLLIIVSLLPISVVLAEQKTTIADRDKEPLVFGFLPILSANKLIKRFSPLTTYLSKKLNRPIRLETAPNYASFVKRTNNEKRYAILFTAPHFYYLAQRKANYKVLVRVAEKDMKAIIVAPKNGPIRTLHDLRGKRLSTADPLALGTILVRNSLMVAGIDPDNDISLVSTPTHNASLLSAFNNVTDAASLMIQPYTRARAEVKDKMRIIAKTIGTPHMPISVAPWLSKDTVAVIEKSMLELNSSQEGKQILKKITWPGVAKTEPAEYAPLGWALKEINLPD